MKPDYRPIKKSYLTIMQAFFCKTCSPDDIAWIPTLFIASHHPHTQSCLRPYTIFIFQLCIIDGTFLILLANPDSHFSPQKPIYIMGDSRRKTQDSRWRRFSLICNSVSCVLSPVSWVLSLNKSDYSHYYVWIAKPFNTNVLQHFHQRIMTTHITYSILILLCRLLSKEIENPWKTLKTVGCRPKTENLYDYLVSADFLLSFLST